MVARVDVGPEIDHRGDNSRAINSLGLAAVRSYRMAAAGGQMERRASRRILFIDVRAVAHEPADGVDVALPRGHGERRGRFLVEGRAAADGGEERDEHRAALAPQDVPFGFRAAEISASM